MRKLLVLLGALGLASCAGPPAPAVRPADQAAAREQMCGPEAQTSRWHNCSALFIAERAELLGASAAQLLAGYHGSVAVALLAMEQQRMSQADGRDVIERLTVAMQRDLPAAKAKDRPGLASRAPVCLPLAGGGDYCNGR